MSVVIILVLTGLLVVNYWTCRDARYPPVLMSGIWLIAMTVYYVSPLVIDAIGILTILVFVSTILAFSGGAYLALGFAEGVPRAESQKSPLLALPSAHPRLKKLFLILTIVLLPFVVQKATQLVSQSDFEFFFMALRDEMQAVGSRGYGHLGYAPLLSWFTTFVYAIEPRRSRGEKFQFYCSLVVSFAYATLLTGRTFFFLLLSVLAGISLMQRSFKFKTFFLAALVFFLSFIFIGIATLKIGRPDAPWSENVSAIGESILTYTEGSLPAIDQVIRRNEPLQYGRNTFLGPLNIVRKLTGKPPASPIQEDVFVPFPTNVYTGIHPVYRDFGIVGVILAFGIIGAASTYFYLRALSGDRLYVFLYSLALFPLLFVTFSDQYFVPMTLWGMYGIAGYAYFRTGVAVRLSNRQREIGSTKYGSTRQSIEV